MDVSWVELTRQKRKGRVEHKEEWDYIVSPVRMDNGLVRLWDDWCWCCEVKWMSDYARVEGVETKNEQERRLTGWIGRESVQRNKRKTGYESLNSNSMSGNWKRLTACDEVPRFLLDVVEQSIHPWFKKRDSTYQRITTYVCSFLLLFLLLLFLLLSCLIPR